MNRSKADNTDNLREARKPSKAPPELRESAAFPGRTEKDAAPQAKGNGTVEPAAKKEKRHSRKKNLGEAISETLEKEAREEREAALAGLNQHYLRLSARMRLAKIASGILLAVFIVVMIGIFRNDITTENLRYLLRDLNISNTVYSNTSEKTVSYETDTDAVFCLFRDNLALSNKSTFTLYSKSGSRIFTEAHNFKNPEITSSDACVIVYDIGGTSYSVYNMLDKVSDQNTAFPISLIAASDDGLYAVVTRNAEYRTAILIYNSKGENIAQIMRDKLTVGIGFSDDGKSVYVSSVYSEAGVMNGEITVYSPYRQDALYTVTMNGRLPAYVRLRDGGLTVMTSTGFENYSREGALEAEYKYENFTPDTVCLGKTYSAVSTASPTISGQSEVAVIDASGNKVLTYPVSGDVKRIKCDGDRIFLLCRGRIVRIDMKTGVVTGFAVDGNPCDINIAGETIFVSYYSYSRTYDLSEVSLPLDTSATETA